MRVSQDEASELTLWVVECQQRLIDLSRKVASRRADPQCSDDVRLKLDESVGTICELTHELFMSAVNLLGLEVIGGDPSLVQERIRHLQDSTEEHIDRLCSLVSNKKDLS